MKVIEPSAEILFKEEAVNVLKRIEIAARTCYKSESAITDTSAEKMVKNLIKSGHGAMLEHAIITVRGVCDRGVSHELVRHRIASFAQESTRYCNYASGKFGNEITVIHPLFFKENTPEYATWYMACQAAESAYLALISQGFSPQEARSVLPNSLKTEIVITMNIREWLHFIDLRALGTTGKPHPQMKQFAGIILREFDALIPTLFQEKYDDFQWEV